ncbi:hypothetical protein EYF80_034917 [Liparis tanakae]|uniref:Uncharacterized protein n=1 Tax=Liparis tanakae TaxID=230148 RepID=A0A4Z2GMV4_9TELE|nr:hypothetical protein EYF80_034917 [Liparis tanakae]
MRLACGRSYDYALEVDVVNLTSLIWLQDEVELGGRVDDLVEAHHVGVLHHLHASHLLEKVRPRHRVQLGLIYHLHRHLEEQTILDQSVPACVCGHAAHTFSPVKTWRASFTTAKCPRPSVLSRSYRPAIFPSRWRFSPAMAGEGGGASFWTMGSGCETTPPGGRGRGFLFQESTCVPRAQTAAKRHTESTQKNIPAGRSSSRRDPNTQLRNHSYTWI